MHLKGKNETLMLTTTANLWLALLMCGTFFSYRLIIFHCNSLNFFKTGSSCLTSLPTMQIINSNNIHFLKLLYILVGIMTSILKYFFFFVNTIFILSMDNKTGYHFLWHWSYATVHFVIIFCIENLQPFIILYVGSDRIYIVISI